MMASASAAALAALAVTVAVPALGDDDNGAQNAHPSFKEMSSCLRAHGLEGAPEDASLKPWVGERLERGDAAAERALEACSPTEEEGVVTVKQAPSPDALRACLERHGVDVPGEGGFALKRWFVEHGDEAANRDALKACDFGPPPEGKAGMAVACGPDKAEGVATAKATEVRAFRGGKPKLADPAG